MENTTDNSESDWYGSSYTYDIFGLHVHISYTHAQYKMKLFLNIIYHYDIYNVIHIYTKTYKLTYYISTVIIYCKL